MFAQTLRHLDGPTVLLPTALAVALLFALLWEHDEQLEIEETELRTFFSSRRQRNAVNVEELTGELNSTVSSVEEVETTLVDLQTLERSLRANVSELVNAIQEAAGAATSVKGEAIGSDRAFAKTAKDLDRCKEQHKRVSADVSQLEDELHSLENEIFLLERRTKNLQTQVVEMENVEVAMEDEDVDPTTPKAKK
jgi:chromosome segregation ATPase